LDVRRQAWPGAPQAQRSVCQTGKDVLHVVVGVDGGQKRDRFFQTSALGRLERVLGFSSSADSTVEAAGAVRG
jgi:hypothetical protein